MTDQSDFIPIAFIVGTIFGWWCCLGVVSLKRAINRTPED